MPDVKKNTQPKVQGMPQLPSIDTGELLKEAMPRIIEAAQKGDAREFAFLINDLVVDTAKKANHDAGRDVVGEMKKALFAYAATKAADSKKLPMKGVIVPILGSIIGSLVNYVQNRAIKEITHQKKQQLVETHHLEREQTSLSVQTNKTQNHLLDVIIKNSSKITTARGPFFEGKSSGGILSVDLAKLKPDLAIDSDSKNECLQEIGKIDKLMDSMEGDNRPIINVALACSRNRYVALLNNSPKNDDLFQAELKDMQKDSTKLITDMYKSIDSNKAQVADSVWSAAKAFRKGGGRELIEEGARAYLGNSKYQKNNSDKIASYLGETPVEHVEKFNPNVDLVIPSHMKRPTEKKKSKAGVVSQFSDKPVDLIGDNGDGLKTLLENLEKEKNKWTEKGDTSMVKQYDAMIDSTIEAAIKSKLPTLLQPAAIKAAKAANTAEGIKGVIAEFTTRLAHNLKASDHAANHQGMVKDAYVAEGAWGGLLADRFGDGFVSSGKTGGGNTQLFVLNSPPVACLKGKPKNPETKTAVALMTSLEKGREKLATGKLSPNALKRFQLKTLIKNTLTQVMSTDNLPKEALAKAKDAISWAVKEIKSLDILDPDLKNLNKLVGKDSDLNKLQGTMTTSSPDAPNKSQDLSALPAQKKSPYSVSEAGANDEERLSNKQLNNLMADIHGDKATLPTPEASQALKGKRLLDNPFAKMAAQASTHHRAIHGRHSPAVKQLVKSFRTEITSARRDRDTPSAAVKAIYTLAKVVLENGESKNPMIQRALAQYPNPDLAAQAIAENADRMSPANLWELLSEAGDIHRETEHPKKNRPAALTAGKNTAEEKANQTNKAVETPKDERDPAPQAPGAN